MVGHVFEILVAMHIVTGATGLVTMWIPVVGRKGSKNHKKWGKVFAWTMLATGSLAIGISVCTLISPYGTHPTFVDDPLWSDPAVVRGVFGWMMLYLAIMTIMLAWYGLLCIRNKRVHERNKNAPNLILQFLTFVAAANCMIQGILLVQPVMIGISVVGLLAAVLNTRFIFQANPPLNEWLIQHTRGLVGAGISVYTAFLAFGAVNYMPALAFTPWVWATPTVLGVSLLLYHQAKITLARRRLEAARA